MRLLCSPNILFTFDRVLKVVVVVTSAALGSLLPKVLFQVDIRFM